jgi:hypothetical protein
MTLPSINIFLWSVALCFHAACTSFRGLFTVRLILGMFEGYALVIYDSVALFTDLLCSSIIAGCASSTLDTLPYLYFELLQLHDHIVHVLHS